MLKGGDIIIIKIEKRKILKIMNRRDVLDEIITQT